MLSPIDAVLEALDADALAALDGDAFEALVDATPATKARFEAFVLRVLAESDRRQLWRRRGYRDAAGWAARQMGERRGNARRDVEVATMVADLPVVAQAFAGGEVSKAKAAELVRAEGATVEQQAELVAAAKRLTVEDVAAEVQRWRHEHDRGAAPIEPRLSIQRTAEHVRLDAVLDIEGGEHLQVALDTAVAQLGLPKEMPYEQRQAHGLVAIGRFFLDHVEDPPTTRAGRPTVVATVDIETLAGTAGGSARLDSGAYISGDAARRLACDAGLVRMITDPASQPLDVGRQTRTVSPAQARAVIHRDRHCRIDGCTAPPWACDIHHILEWVRDHGPTDLANLLLVCWFHHHQLHDTDGRLVRTADGRYVIAADRGQRLAA